MTGYLEIAAAEIGYRGNPENVTKYWADLAPSLQGEEWCAAFVSWCLEKAGQIALIGGRPMYSCPAMVRAAQGAGQWTSAGRSGALALYGFGSSIAAHVEFVVSVSATSLVAIGGNTSGDVVAEKTRSLSDVLGFWDIGGIPGSLPGGAGVIGAGYLLKAPAATIVGESGDANARFAAARSQI